MELSRVKKYEDLRKSLENEVKPSVNVSESEPKAVSEAISDMIKPVDKTYTPTHEKNEVFVETIKSDELDTTFKNEYLDSFIQEVRDYNIKKGVREYEDTKLDILQQLNSKNREKRSNYVESIKEESAPISDTMEISKQVLDLLNEAETTPAPEVVMDEVQAETMEEPKIENTLADLSLDKEEVTPVVEPVEETQEASEETATDFHKNELEERIASLETQFVQTRTQTNEEESMDEDLESFSKRELVEETMKLKVQMDEYKEELEDLNTGIDSNNRLLNIIITILIVALLAVIGVVVYWLVSGGII